MNHLSGKKFTSSHTTATDATRELLAQISEHPDIKKISLGIIIRTSGKSGRRKIKISDEPACLFLKIHGNSSVQEVRIYTDQKEKVRSEILLFS